MYSHTCPILQVIPSYAYHYCPIAYRTNIYPGVSEEQMHLEDESFRPEKKAAPKKSFTLEEAASIAKILKIDFGKERFNLEQFRKGLDVELEHGRRDPATNVTGDDPILTGKIALAHLNEFPDYYDRLAKLEAEAKSYWGKR